MRTTTIGFRVLGPLDIDGADAHALRPAQRRLVSLLLLEPGRAIHRDVLIDRMWPEGAPSTARNTLQAHVSGLRRVLGVGSVVMANGAYRLAVVPEQVDVTHFVELCARARASVAADPAAAVDLGERAQLMWRGEPFDELADDSFAFPDIARLHELRYVAVEAALAGRQRTDRLGEVTADLEGLARRAPHREALWGYLALARHVTGRRAAALHTFTEARHALAEVGIDPGPQLQRLQRSLLHDEPSRTSDALAQPLAS